RILRRPIAAPAAVKMPQRAHVAGSGTTGGGRPDSNVTVSFDGSGVPSGNRIPVSDRAIDSWAINGVTSRKPCGPAVRAKLNRLLVPKDDRGRSKWKVPVSEPSG